MFFPSSFLLESLSCSTLLQMAWLVLLAFTVTASLISGGTPHATESPAEVYWRTKLGDATAMPRIVKEGLIGTEEYAKSFVLRDQSKAKPSDSREFKMTDQVKDSVRKIEEVSSYVVYGAGVDSYLTKPADKKQASVDHTVVLTEKDLLHPGKSLKLNMMKTDDGIQFIPAQVAKSIPFTSAKLPTILRIFNVDPKSDEAEIMEHTLRGCEYTGVEGEDKYCATTLEDLVDYVTTHTGNNVTALSTYVDKEIKGEQRIESVKKVGKNNNSNLICHKMGYPYAVFYCHNIKDTDLYNVTFVDIDGKKMNEVGVCHKNTSSWSPNHAFLRLLNAKPGGIPVCHLLGERTVAWFPNN